MCRYAWPAKTMPWKFRIVKPKNSGVINFVSFLKGRPIFKRFYCFCKFVTKHFKNTGLSISKKTCYNAKPLAYYIYVKTKILLDFHICISIPLIISHIIPKKQLHVSRRWVVTVTITNFNCKTKNRQTQIKYEDWWKLKAVTGKYKLGPGAGKYKLSAGAGGRERQIPDFREYWNVNREEMC